MEIIGEIRDEFPHPLPISTIDGVLLVRDHQTQAFLGLFVNRLTF